MKPKKEAELKARVETATKQAVERLSLLRDLDVSDLLREAVRDLLAKHRLDSRRAA